MGGKTMEHRSRWMESMIAKHGSEAAVRQFMRDAANKSSRNQNGTGGFAALEGEQLREISRRGGEARAKKYAEKQNKTSSQDAISGKDSTDNQAANS